MNKSISELWLEDIDFLRDNLIKNHISLFFNINKDEFNNRIEILKSKVSDFDYYEMKVELSKIVALVKDAHTSISFGISRYLPFKFFYFEDGVYIIEAVSEYEHLLNKKVEEIENINMKEVMDKLKEVISYENMYFLKAQSMKYLQAVDILYGLMICDEFEKVKMIIDGQQIEINTVKCNELVYVKQDNVPLYRERNDENYWFKYLEDEETLYIKYNFCREQEGLTINRKIIETINLINKMSINKLTIDLRNNLGGDSILLEPLIKHIKGNHKINRKGNLKVIIGRETFSSGLLNAYQFKRETEAIIIGEPSGGKPNCYGEVLRFTLPNSKFSVSYSTRYYKLIEDDSAMALYPDEELRYIYE